MFLLPALASIGEPGRVKVSRPPQPCELPDVKTPSERAIEAPQIRRLFSCSPQDPRYHMLEHLSPKFRMPAAEREPRAALILNRFTRSLSIMFATNAVAAIVGLSPQDLRDQSFYDCISENCLEEAVRCLEGAKANDSIAYLRFWSRDPRRPEDFADSQRGDSADRESSSEVSLKVEDEDGNDEHLPLWSQTNTSGGDHVVSSAEYQTDFDHNGASSARVKVERDEDTQSTNGVPLKRSSSEPPVRRMSQLPSRSPSAERQHSESSGSSGHSRYPAPSVELEAVVSCTSDGLVVVIRRARPAVPGAEPPRPSAPAAGLFAAPWARNPVHPAYVGGNMNGDPHAMHSSMQHPRGPPVESLMRSIREVAVFAWALVGINENIAMHGDEMPRGEAAPPDWTPPSNGYPVHSLKRKAEDMQESSDCWIGCRCKVDKPPTFGYPHKIHAGQHPGLHCDCSECRQPDNSLHHQQSGYSQAGQLRFGSAMRPGLRSHASTSNLPTANSAWWAEHHGRSDGAQRREDAEKWPYTGP